MESVSISLLVYRRGLVRKLCYNLGPHFQTNFSQPQFILDPGHIAKEKKFPLLYAAQFKIFLIS